MLPLTLAATITLLGWGTVRHINGRPAPILLTTLCILLTTGGVAEARWQLMQARYTEVSRELLGREDTYVVCERLTAALLSPWNRAGWVNWTADNAKPSRADLTWETCRNLRQWQRSGGTSAKREHLYAVHVLTHEMMHLEGHMSEADAECFALQSDARTALLLGAKPAAARALAQSIWRDVYPVMPPAYRSADCVEGGRLDLTPSDGHWP